MTNSIHTMQTAQTKDFDFFFLSEETLSRHNSAYKGFHPTPVATSTASAFAQASLRQFHDEFKSLVLASNQAHLNNEEMAWEDTILQTIIEPHEIEWLDWGLEQAPVITDPAAPQEAHKSETGKPSGTPSAIEIWTVKAIAGLLILNVLFAGLIVTGTRISNWIN